MSALTVIENKERNKDTNKGDSIDHTDTLPFFGTKYVKGTAHHIQIKYSA